MTVCYFGNYIRDYPRNHLMIKGLRLNGVAVLECQTRQRGFKKYRQLFKQHRALKNKYDILVVAFQGHSLVWFAKLLSARPVFFDAFVSLYLTNVEDRQIAKPNALKSKYWAWLDKISCQLADHVLLDTRAQIDYFISEYSLPAEKFTRIYVGADDEIYYPTNKPSATPEQFIVHWHGHIVPFHGLETIIKAAQQLTQYPDIKFQIITRSTKKYQQIKNLTERLGLNNVKFYPETSYQSLARLMNQADVCLGVFGANLKAQVVIPNKIYEALACAKPVITSSQPAMRELFTNGFNIYTVPAVNPQALARAVLKLKGNPGLRQQLGDNAFRLYQEKLKPKIITQPLKQLCQSLLVN